MQTILSERRNNGGCRVLSPFTRPRWAHDSGAWKNVGTRDRTSPMKRAAVLFSVVIASACPPAELGQIKICSFESFDTASNTCPSDERNLNTGGVVCSLV